MKRSELNKRITELISSYKTALKEECTRLVNSGAVEYEKEDLRSYKTAKSILCVAAENISATRLSVFDSEDKKIRANLRKF